MQGDFGGGKNVQIDSTQNSIHFALGKTCLALNMGPAISKAHLDVSNKAADRGGQFDQEEHERNRSSLPFGHFAD
jgi:hypothetical protein